MPSGHTNPHHSHMLKEIEKFPCVGVGQSPARRSEEFGAGCAAEHNRPPRDRSFRATDLSSVRGQYVVQF